MVLLDGADEVGLVAISATVTSGGTAEQLAGSAYQLVAPGLARITAHEIIESLVDRQVDGIIAIASEIPTEWIERLALHTPVVVLGRHDNSRTFDTIFNDDEAGTNLVMDHLLGPGHTRIAHLTIAPPTDQAPPTSSGATNTSSQCTTGWLSRSVQRSGSRIIAAEWDFEGNGHFRRVSLGKPRSSLLLFASHTSPRWAPTTGQCG